MITFSSLSMINNQPKKNNTFTSRPMLKMNTGVKCDTVSFSSGKSLEPIVPIEFLSSLLEEANKLNVIAKAMDEGNYTGKVRLENVDYTFVNNRVVEKTYFKNAAKKHLKYDENGEIIEETFHRPDGTPKRTVIDIDENSHKEVEYDLEGKPEITKTITDKNNVPGGKLSEIIIHGKGGLPDRILTIDAEIYKYLLCGKKGFNL